MNIINIIIENTEYSILIYCLLNKNWINDIFILSNILPKKFLKNFKKNVKKTYIFEATSLKKNPFNFYFSLLKLYIFFLKISFRKNIQIYGNDDLEYFIFIKKNYILLEDGLINYLEKRKRTIKELVKKFIKLKNPLHKPFGYSKNVKKIYLTGLAPIPKEIKSKVQLINLKELWNKKTKEEKKEILNIFGFNENILNNIKCKKYILFTQPLSEDNLISEKEKMDLYKKIINNYDKKLLIIKIHPREKTNYKIYFPNIQILDQSFPAELFELLDIKFEKVITIFSTAALNFSINSKIDFYGTEIHPNLLKKIGSMECIMKRNKFL